MKRTLGLVALALVGVVASADAVSAGSIQHGTTVERGGPRPLCRLEQGQWVCLA